MLKRNLAVRILASIAAGALACLAQDTALFRTDISLVRVDAEVTDGTQLLAGLHKEDFLIKDNGQPQPILYFSQDVLPLDLILLFDISGSMRPNVQKAAVTARVALAELHAGDRVAVMTFHSRSQIVATFTDDLDAVERTINVEVLAGKFKGGTRLLAGVDDAAKYFLEQPRTGRRRAVLILTDDYGQRSRRPSTVVHRLWEADAILSGLIIRSGAGTAITTASMIANPVMGLAMREGMDGVADKTGGDTIKADDPGDAFRDAMRRIRLRYSLYYAMPAAQPGEQRQVKVELTADALRLHPTGRVRARRGYLAPSGTSRN
jgi:VWFA-related protein